MVDMLRLSILTLLLPLEIRPEPLPFKVLSFPVN